MVFDGVALLVQASKRFEEHYQFRVSAATVDRVTKASALGALSYLEQKLRKGKDPHEQTSKDLSEAMLVELDDCEIRTGIFAPTEYRAEDEPPTRKKIIAWRDVRVGRGQIIAIGTDGIWEAHSKHGEMFGKARFRDALRRLAEMKVEGIIEAIFEELREFTTGVQPEDDVTLVVMRVKDGDT